MHRERRPPDLRPGELAVGERILWTGAPDLEASLLSQWHAALFGTVCLMLAGSGFVEKLQTGRRLEALVVFGFVLIGCVVVMAPVFESLRARRTSYVITTERLIVTTGGGRRTVSVQRARIAHVERTDRRGKTTLRMPVAMIGDGDERSVEYLHLRGIRDGERAYQLLVAPLDR